MNKRFLTDRAAATAIEYALIAGLIAMAIVTAVVGTGINLQALYSDVASKVDEAAN